MKNTKTRSYYMVIVYLVLDFVESIKLIVENKKTLIPTVENKETLIIKNQFVPTVEASIIDLQWMAGRLNDGNISLFFIYFSLWWLMSLQNIIFSQF